jgi:hypothetical protein
MVGNFARERVGFKRPNLALRNAVFCAYDRDAGELSNYIETRCCVWRDAFCLHRLRRCRTEHNFAKQWHWFPKRKSEYATERRTFI